MVNKPIDDLLATNVLAELGMYLDNEINNRDLEAEDENGVMWTMHSGVFKGAKGHLEILLEDASGRRRGVTIELKVEHYNPSLPPRR
jgi:hypothetical protein